MPERELGVLGEVVGLDVLELGCGAARWSVELARQGARCTALDVSGRQLEHAARVAVEAGQAVALVHAAASAVPLSDASMDLIFCDHGGLTYDDPAQVVAQCARLLRSGGQLVFNTTSPWAAVCLEVDNDTVGRQLVRPYFDLGRTEDADGITWVLGHGAWMACLRDNGLVVDALHELRRPVGDGGGWARDYPAEDLWCAHRP